MLVGISVPSFVVGGLLQYFLAVKWPILPVARYETFASTLMPAFALSLATMATIARYMRASMLEVVSADYIRTAVAKGLRPREIVWRHQIRNAIFPVLTILGPVIASVLTGSFVIETIFAVPGLGRYFVIAMQNLDYTLVMGLTVFFGAFLIAMNFLVDVAYGLDRPADPHPMTAMPDPIPPELFAPARGFDDTLAGHPPAGLLGRRLAPLPPQPRRHGEPRAPRRLRRPRHRRAAHLALQHRRHRPLLHLPARPPGSTGSAPTRSAATSGSRSGSAPASR